MSQADLTQERTLKAFIDVKTPYLVHSLITFDTNPALSISDFHHQKASNKNIKKNK
jgi:hypothetical protein